VSKSCSGRHVLVQVRRNTFDAFLTKASVRVGIAVICDRYDSRESHHVVAGIPRLPFRGTGITAGGLHEALLHERHSHRLSGTESAESISQATGTAYNIIKFSHFHSRDVSGTEVTRFLLVFGDKDSTVMRTNQLVRSVRGLRWVCDFQPRNPCT
jgi:hypothetical protein